MMLLRQTGLRINNLVTFTVADAKTVLSDPNNRVKLRDDDSKKNHGYIVKFNQRACRSLRELLKLHSLSNGQTLDSYPLVMSRQQGRGLSKRSFQDRMKKWVLSVGLDVNASPHWFRHTLAKRILARTTHNSPLQVVQHALGHTDLRSTELYTHPDRQDIDKAMELAS